MENLFSEATDYFCSCVDSYVDSYMMKSGILRRSNGCHVLYCCTL